ncbi:hypothetical protein BDV32DRAFT_30553 [Aspergillus pseudonomiae]|uniref:Uncharacterized protein n=1 Tax=Aspergillus pseudonomiae TaxID=1506151 RepID=A0A5N7CWP0_9EURO|nr:uncharacterized protein BDV37DRAFT_263449 [Aspergillus pseudonomiae]KAB8261738.1 hypothetical protein BDV32DRAFT_30553 [Aspergillus pseudonomiae]KAE8398379.1 hypothetical protein BDV37DRAFT_263449 [Aspergillus pseudonomiae]
MSFKSKNLAYEAKEPAFLQRLRNQYGDTSGRLERPIARPRKLKDADDDDDPTYVDEESNEVISKEEYEALVRESNKEGEDTGKGEPDPEQTTSQDNEQDKASTTQEAPISKQNMAEIGGPKKRKQAKVIGEEEPAAEKEEIQPKDTGSRKPKQKKKKIKLSFDEE